MSIDVVQQNLINLVNGGPLDSLVNSINDSDITADELYRLSDKRVQLYLQTAAKLAAMSSLEMAYNNLYENVSPWGGGYTLVAVDTNGIIRGAYNNPQGRVYEVYGRNLFPHALKKVAYRLYLDREGYSGGLNSAVNLDFIRQAIPEGESLYLGEAATGKGVMSDGGLKHLVIGASGCELDMKYRNGLAPEMIKEGVVDFVAGFADMWFAEIVVNYIERSTTAPLRIWEPEFFTTLRRSH